MAAPRPPPIRTMKPRLAAVRAGKLSRACAARPISCWSKAPAARPKSICAPDDIANMGFARAADVPVVLIGDIDRGGVIASLVGTKAVLGAEDARADRRLHRQQVPRRSRACLLRACDASRRRPAGSRSGWCRISPTRALLPAEDALALEQKRPAKPARACASPCRSCRTSPISTISIRSTPSPRSSSCACGRAKRCRAMPTSSSCPARRRPSPISTALRSAGLDIDIAAHRRRGGMMLGTVRRLSDARHDASPIRAGIEGPPGSVAGLGLLDIKTTLSDDKRARTGARARRATVRRSPATRCIWA